MRNHPIATFPRRSQGENFTGLINYLTHESMTVRVHGVTSIETAAIEMDAVAEQNTRCADPAFHFILSWPAAKKPALGAIFDATEHAIRSLGLGQHQYIVAVHDNTDNRHCHIAVNRINPVTFKAQDINWAMLKSSIKSNTKTQ